MKRRRAPARPLTSYPRYSDRTCSVIAPAPFALDAHGQPVPDDFPACGYLGCHRCPHAVGVHDRQEIR